MKIRCDDLAMLLGSGAALMVAIRGPGRRAHSSSLFTVILGSLSAIKENSRMKFC